MKFSILILTRNEEINLDICLKNLFWCDDIVVLDSYSKDNTIEISKKYSVRTYQRSFDNFANQRNFGLINIEYKNEWLLMLDADEIIPDDLKDEIASLKDDPNIALYCMRRKDFFWGRWIKRSSGYPTWFGRLMRIGDVSVTRSINEQYETQKGTGYLSGHLYHYPFRKGLEHWIAKHNQYSTLESKVYSPEKTNLYKLFSRDPLVRRRIVKKIFYKLPARPLLFFLLIYIFKGGFLDGTPGFHYCLLKTIYEYFICCKIKNSKMLCNFQ